MTQKEEVLELLKKGRVCGTVFQDKYIPEYRTRINEIRRNGAEIETRPCQSHTHRSHTLQEWRIKQNPAHSAILAPSREELAANRRRGQFMPLTQLRDIFLHER